MKWNNKERSYFRFEREWLLINCSANLYCDGNITLLFQKNESSSKQPLQIPRVESVSNDMFNITRLQRHDEGDYFCDVCEKQLKYTLKFYLNGKKSFHAVAIKLM